MKVLYCKVFGLGNAVMAVPAIKAIASVHGPVDVMIGSLPDDGGALDVIANLKQSTQDVIDAIYINTTPMDAVYDVAVLAIPFDGRWANGVHFRAKSVLDGRPRPGDPNVLGIECWKKGEVEYQLDNAIELGYEGPTDPASIRSNFYLNAAEADPDLVYVGVGFKRDPQTFWSQKHWGNERFARFIKEAARLRPTARFITTGGHVDIPVIREIEAAVKPAGADLTWKFGNISQAFREIGSAGSFFGNDTGMAHVAASFNRPTYMMTAFKGSEVKNPPWCARARCNPFHTEVMEPESVAQDFIDFVWGSNE